ncbi:MULTISPECIES: hypothetical protein [Burkholderia]|uniref:hypothetical protein n=1 Tax=Burkholderia TaxID=32008 RepID=UPI0005B6FE79|nr:MULTISPECIES: hypothetical protein [Burkholderia]KIP17316.1 hypothetical protein KY49_6831 [Burkholderia sp. MSHR3999]
MKAWIEKHGRTVGGVFGVASAVTFWFDLKFVGVALAGCAIVSVVSAERAKKAALGNN